MKNLKKMAKALLIILLATVALDASSQTPDYSCVAKNDTLLSSTVYQFDIYIYRTGVNDLYLNNYQLCFQINNVVGILNGGTLSGTYVSGSSDLPSAWTPGGVNILTSGASKYIRVNGVSATGNGTLVPVTGLRIGTFRISNTVAYSQSNMNLSWCNIFPATTSVRAIVPPATSGSVSIITNMTTHTLDLVDPVLNLAVTAFNMTGGGTYCHGTSGNAVGTSGSQSGVLYLLYKNSVATGSYIPGTGATLNFGNQLNGTYTCSAYRKATYLTGSMTGNSVVTEINVNPTVSGNNSVCNGSSGVVYTTEAGMSNYLWSISAGGNITSGGGFTDNTITVTWNTAGAQTVNINYTNTLCTAASATVYPVTVHALPVTTISGSNSICALSTGNVYSTTAGLSNYAWSISAGGTVTAGGTATSNSITISWNSSGARWVKVVGTNSFGCKDSTTLNVNVRPNPSTVFSPSDTSLCLRGNSFNFTNSSSISSGTYGNQWYFGDGNSSTGISPTHSYTIPGNFSVKLLTTSNFGCKDSLIKTIHVRPHPATNVIPNDTLECLRGNNFIFTNLTTISSGTFTNLWKFGDGATSTAFSVTHSYSSAGTYFGKLVSTSDFGCKDSNGGTFYVKPHPASAFSPADTSECLRGNNFVFTNSSSIPAGSFTNFWHFGDNTTATVASPNHTYTTDGNYTVKLITISGFGCKDSVSKTIHVRPHPQTMVSVNDTSQCLRGNNFIVNSSSTISSGTFTLLWKFGDGSTSTLASTSHTYAAAGTYHGTLVTTSGFGCKDSSSGYLYVRPHPSTAFSLNDTSFCLRGNNFVFTNNTGISSGTFSNLWFFGDGINSAAVSPSYTYLSAGNYNSKLITTSNFGCKDSISRTVHVRPHPASAFSVSDSSVCLRGNNFVFTNNTSISSGMFSSIWRFGDNISSTATSPSHSYALTGNYSAKLIATSDFGCKDSMVKTMYVRPHPVASFTTFDTSQCLRGNNFVFANNSYITSGTFTNLWKFGDGNTSVVSSLFHSYSAAGNFTAKLITTSGFGCKDSISKSMYVRPHPASLFTPGDTSLCLRGNSFTFTNNSSILSGTFSNKWYFGDGNSNTVISPVHAFTLPGNYNVKLVTTSDYNCKDSISKTIYVRPHPATAFAVSDTSLCLRGNNFNFINNTTIGAGTFSSLWKFGDAVTSTLSSPSYSYLSAATFYVNLVTTSLYGCKDSIGRNIYVRPHPLSLFTVNDTSQCLRGNNFAFTNSSSIPSGSFTNLWAFGDGNSSVTGSPSQNYAATGTYEAKLVLTSDFGCKDSSSKFVHVRPHPASSASINDTDQCLHGNNFILTNNTTISSGSFTNLWKFCDGSTSVAYSPSYIYGTAGIYHAVLVTTSDFGCKDSIGGYLYVRPHPVSAFVINDSSQCQRLNNFAFTNNTNILSGSFTDFWDFGDSKFSAATSPTHNYSTIGTYIVKLLSTSDFGCTDSITHTVYVRPHPITAFTVTDTSLCLRGNSFDFNDASSLISGSYTGLWHFGDNSTSTLPAPSHSYSTAGNYTTWFVTTSNFGCKDSISRLIYVRPHPASSFHVNDTMLCLNGNNFSFSNTTGIATGTFTDLWHFGDLSTSALVSPSHSYATAGSFTVKLVSTSDFGCSDSISRDVYVKPHPVTAFTQNDTSICLRGNNFIFTNGSTIPSGSFTGLWSFGDNSSSGLFSPAHTYTSVGSYQVKLVNTSDFGCKDSLIKTMHVRPHPLASWVTIDTSLCQRGNSFVFANSSTIPSGTFSSLWKFGDMTTSTATALFHTYAASGIYQAWLVAKSDFGCLDSISRNLYVRPHPVTNFVANDTAFCLPGNNFIFTNNSSITSGTFTSHWNFGDGNTSNLASVSHSYGSIGNYQVMLSTTSDFGCKDSSIQTMHIVSFPVASFTMADTSLCLRGNNFSFNNNTTVGAGTFSSLWHFGDLNNSVVTSPTHTYASAGSFNVKLIVTSGYGCIDSVMKTVHVRPHPMASFTVSDTAMCQKNNNFVFTNNSTIASGTFSNLWHFGDNNSSAITSPSHTYLLDGTFAARLVLTSDFGCKDSFQRNIHIRPLPVPAFDINDTLQCFRNNQFHFQNKTTINSGSFSNVWKFGDGITGYPYSPVYSYNKTGIFTVTLTTTSNYGCKSSVSHVVHVLASPVVSLGGNQTVYDTQTVNLDAGAGFDSYLWSDTQSTQQISLDTSAIGYKPTIYWVKVMKNGCPGYDSVLVTFLHSTAIDDPEYNFNLAVFPNPASSTLNVVLEGLTHDVTIRLMDIQGKSIRTMKHAAGLKQAEQIDISNLSKGIYYLEISNEEVQKTVRVIKN